MTFLLTHVQKNETPEASPYSPSNPYLDGRREWQERYLDLVKARRNWQLCAGFLCVLLLIALVGVVYVGTLPKTVPFVIQVSESGQVLALGAVPEDRTATADERITAFVLQDWVRCARSVFGDWDALKHQYDRLYAFTDNPAKAELTKYYSEHDPAESFPRQTVIVAIRSVLRLSAQTWQVRWSEEWKSRDGQKLGVTTWEAVFTLAARPPASHEETMKNPFGLFVTHFAWTQAM